MWHISFLRANTQQVFFGIGKRSRHTYLKVVVVYYTEAERILLSSPEHYIQGDISQAAHLIAVLPAQMYFESPTQ